MEIGRQIEHGTFHLQDFTLPSPQTVLTDASAHTYADLASGVTDDESVALSPRLRLLTAAQKMTRNQGQQFLNALRKSPWITDHPLVEKLFARVCVQFTESK